MKKQLGKKLILNRETLRNLGLRELSLARGGYTEDCNTRGCPTRLCKIEETKSCGC